MTFNWWTFLFEALNFVALAYILHRLLYRPLREAIDKRREANARAEREAEKAQQEAETLQRRLEERLATAEQQQQELIHQARQQAESERQNLLAEAERAAQRRQDKLRQALEQERKETLESLGHEVVAQALKLTGRLLGEACDRTLHQQLALRLVQALEQLPAVERESLQGTWASGDGPVLESAQDLDARTLEALTEAVVKVMGQPVALRVLNRPELLGGVRLRLAGHIWDGSLASQVTADDPAARKDGQP